MGNSVNELCYVLYVPWAVATVSVSVQHKKPQHFALDHADLT